MIYVQDALDGMLGKDKARYEGEIAKVEEKWLEMSTQLEDAERAIA